MNLLMDLFNKRSSVRNYQECPVEREKVLQCLEAARLAPSAHNGQPWRYIIVDDPKLKDELCSAAFSGIFALNKYAKTAPVIVVVLARPDFVANKIGAMVVGLQFYLLDIGASIEHFLLCAAHLGLGACWLGWFSESGIRKLLKIDKKDKIVSLISLGYPKEENLRKKSRMSIEEISSFNSYKP